MGLAQAHPNNCMKTFVSTYTVMTCTDNQLIHCLNDNPLQYHMHMLYIAIVCKQLATAW